MAKVLTVFTKKLKIEAANKNKNSKDMNIVSTKKWFGFQTANDRMGRIMPLALLHSLLLQQCYYGNTVLHNQHHWSLTDLAMAVDVYKKV